jgi:uncharacterized protein YbjT (DUF2867 family)
VAEAILVTGATGNVGAEVVKQLQNRGLPLVAAVRSVEKARAMLGDGVSYVPFDFTRPETFATAFANVQTLLLVRPPELANVNQAIAPAISAARQAGVAHVVFLSLLGAERNPVVPHYRVEQVLRESGMAWTFLRASFFLQNLDTTHRVDIRDNHEIFVPAGRGRTSFIDARDIAAVAALALTTPGHAGQAYPLTGAAALSYGAVAQIFSEVLGRPIRYARPSALSFALRMRARRYPWPYIAVMVGIYTTARLGLAATVTPDTEGLLGRPPISVRQYVEDYRASWQ